MKHVLILCLIIAVFCAGCGDSEPPVNNQPDDQVSAPSGTPATPIVPTTPEEVDNSNNETTANEGTMLENESSVRAVFIGNYKRFSPVAFFRDGESLLNYGGRLVEDSNLEDSSYVDSFVSSVEDPTQEVGPYTDSLFSFLGVDWDMSIYSDREYFKQPWADSLATQSFHYASTGDEKVMGIISYEELFYDDDYEYSHDYSYEKRLQTPELAINTDVPFIDDFKHIRYTPENQNQKQLPATYLDHIKNKLQNAGLGHTPAIISDVYYYDFDGDGKEEAIVVADNHPHKKKPSALVQPEQLAYKDKMGTYLIMTFFSQTMGTIDLLESFVLLDDQLPFLSNDLSEEDSFYYDALYLFHQDDLILSTNIGSGSPYWEYHQTPIACDFNGDGLFDLGISDGDAVFTIYLQENKQLNKLCHLYLPM